MYSGMRPATPGIPLCALLGSSASSVSIGAASGWPSSPSVGSSFKSKQRYDEDPAYDPRAPVPHDWSIGGLDDPLQMTGEPTPNAPSVPPSHLALSIPASNRAHSIPDANPTPLDDVQIHNSLEEDLEEDIHDVLDQ
ncbi:unnamed protein product [Calypogeia fissa]